MLACTKAGETQRKLPIEAREDKKPFNIFIPTTTVELGAGNGCQNRHKTLQSKVYSSQHLYVTCIQRERSSCIYIKVETYTVIEEVRALVLLVLQ